MRSSEWICDSLKGSNCSTIDFVVGIGREDELLLVFNCRAIDGQRTEGCYRSTDAP